MVLTLLLLLLSLPQGGQYAHGKIGISVMAFALLQPIMGVVLMLLGRPDQGESTPLVRAICEMIHHVTGVLALCFAVFNMFYGIYVVFFINLCVLPGGWQWWVGVIAALLIFWALLQALLDR